MKNLFFKNKPLVGLILLALTLGFGAGPAQAAGTAANASIVNVVTVNYSDASGTFDFTQSATSTVTVDLLAAIPTIGAPTPASGGTYNSGTLVPYAFDLYSNANGPDTYDFDLSVGTTADSDFVAGTVDKYIASIYNAAGVPTTYAAGAVTSVNIEIGATVIIAGTAGGTVSIPAGTGTANSIDVGDFVTIGGTIYQATAVNDGTIAAHNTGNNDRDAEIPGSVTLRANDGAGNWTVVPDLSGTVAGTPLSEYYVANVIVTAVADSLLLADANIYFNLDLTSDTDPAATINRDDTQTIFKRDVLTITKTASPTSAQPGDTVTYTVLVAVQGAKATAVEVLDNVPEYTELTTYPGIFATIEKCDLTGIAAGVISYTNCGTPEDISDTTEDEDITLGSGDAAGATYPSALRFFIGAGNSGEAPTPTGGEVKNLEVFKIVYSVDVL